MNATAEATTWTYTDPYPGKDDSEAIFLECWKCMGDGGMEYYAHIDGGICYACEGGKGKWTTVKAERKREKARIARLNREERKAVQRQADHAERLAAYIEQRPVLAEWDDRTDGHATLSDLWMKMFDYDLSDKQLDLAVSIIEDQKERDRKLAEEIRNKVPAPEGKVTVEGEVVSAKLHESFYGYHNTTSLKMVVKAEGFKVWATIPQKLMDQLDAETEGGNAALSDLRGRRVSFVATLEQAPDDKSFAFAKRPSKAKLI